MRARNACRGWLVYTCTAAILASAGGVAFGQAAPEACCVSDTCRMLTPQDCQAIGGIPEGPGTTCDGTLNVCEQACCKDNVCLGIMFAGVCLAQGGKPEGPGSTCVVGVPCAPQACTGDAQCDDGDLCTTDHCDPTTGTCVHDPVNCDDGDVCTIDMCDPAVGCVHLPNPDCSACCLPDGSCEQLLPSICQQKGGKVQPAGTTCTTTTCEPPLAVKFRQPPTEDLEDIASDLWVSPNGIQKMDVDVADDFRSDGRPISAVRWWGSYLIGEYMPQAYGGYDQVPYQIDGWMLSFHLPTTVKSTTSANPKRPALGLYFAPREAVQITLTNLTSCDGHKVFEYYVDLAKCCLIQSTPDPRLPATVPDRCPAQPASFNEHHCYWYALDVQAVVGIKWLNATGGLCCERIFTNNVALGDFWGWHTTSIESGARPAVQTTVSFGDPLQSPCPPLNQCAPTPRWLYGPWSYVKPVCPYDHRINMAFELLTPVMQVPDSCKPLHLVGAASLKTHGAAGEFGVDLPLSPPYGIEGRVGGPTKIVLTLDQEVAAGDGSVDIGDEISTSVGVIDSISVVSNTITVLMHGAPTAGCVTLTVANGPDGVVGVSGEPLDGVNQVSVVSLAGDANGDGVVSLADMVQIRNHLNAAADASNFRLDVRADGKLNLGDLVLVRDNANARAHCP